MWNLFSENKPKYSDKYESIPYKYRKNTQVDEESMDSQSRIFIVSDCISKYNNINLIRLFPEPSSCSCCSTSFNVYVLMEINENILYKEYTYQSKQIYDDNSIGIIDILNINTIDENTWIYADQLPVVYQPDAFKKYQFICGYQDNLMF